MTLTALQHTQKSISYARNIHIKSKTTQYAKENLEHVYLLRLQNYFLNRIS